MEFKEIEIAVNFSDFSRARVRTCPLNFRFGGQGPSFRLSHEVPLVKPTLVNNTRAKWHFNPRLCLYSESKTAKSSLHSPDIESYIIRKPRDSLEPLAFSSCLRQHPFVVRAARCVPAIISHLHARATPATMGPPNIYFLGPSFVRPIFPRGPLNLVKSDNEPDRTPSFDFEVKRLRRRVLGPRSFPAHRFVLAMLFRRGRSNFLICLGCGMWFSRPARLPSATRAPCKRLVAFMKNIAY